MVTQKNPVSLRRFFENPKHMFKFIDKNINTFYEQKSVLFVCFVVLCPKSTAMVMAGQSVHLTKLFPGQA